MMRRYGHDNSDISPEPVRGLNVSDLNNTLNNNDNIFDDGLYIGPIQLSFSSSNSSIGSHRRLEEEEDDEEENVLDLSLAATTTSSSSDIDSNSSNSSIDTVTDDDDDDDDEENGIDLDAIMRHIDDCGRHIKRNLTDIVRVELENLLNSLQPRRPLVPYPVSSEEEL